MTVYNKYYFSNQLFITTLQFRIILNIISSQVSYNLKMNQSLRFFGLIFIALLIATTNSQPDTNPLYNLNNNHLLNTIITPNTNTQNEQLPTIPLSQQNYNNNPNLLQQQNPTTTTPPHPQQQTPIAYNPQDYSSLTNPPLNPISPVQQYNPILPTPIPTQIQVIAVGINKTISLLSKQSQKYSLLVTESKKESILFFVIGPFSNVSYEQTSIKLTLVHPNGTEQSLNKCEDIGVNVCLLPGSLLKSGDHILADIECVSDQTCMFDLETYWSSAYPLHLNKPLTMDFQVDAYAKLFHIDVTNKNFKQLRIILTTKTILEGDSPIHLYANFGNQPPTKQKHDLAGIHLWDDGLGIFVEKSKLSQTRLTLIVEGPASNVLEIEAKVITDYDHLLKLNVLQYDYLDKNSERSYYFNVPKNKIQMNLKLSTFTGSVQIIFYKDSKFTEIFMTGEFETFGDRLYRLPAAHLEGANLTDKLYIKVKSGHNPSTYVLKLTAATQKSMMLSTDISDMGELKQGQIVNYYVNTYLDPSSHDSKVLKFTLHNIVGRNIPKFRLCHETQQSNCFVNYTTYVSNKTKYDQIKPTSISTSGSTAIYKVTLEPKLFVLDSHASKFKKVILSIVVAQQNNDRFLYGIQYADDSVIKTLREGTPVKDRLTIGSRKLYKVAPLSKDVVSVHIHLVQISGKVGMFGTKTDPRGEGFQGQNLQVPIKNELSYRSQQLKDNHTIFIIVQGQDNAMFSLTTTFKRGVELSQSLQFKDKFNHISLPENVQQQITIQPYTFQVVYLATNFFIHQFSYQSSFAVELCARKDNLKFPKDPNCEIKIGSAKTLLPEAKGYFIGIGNPSNKTAAVTVKYSNIFGCQQKNIGSPWKKYFESSNLSKCVQYTIHKNQSMEIITSLDTYSYPSMHSTIYINDYKHQLNQPYIFLDSNVFTEHCHNNFCIVAILFQNLTKTNVQVLAQYVDQEIGLLDGISQEIFTVASPSSYKKFKFWIPNKDETTIILESGQGHFEFYVTIRDEFEGHMNDQIYPTKTNYMFKSNNTYYTMYNTLTITAQQLQNVSCTSCVLYISVVGIEDSYMEKARFIIQASQQRKVLKPLVLTPGYLSSNSFSYYEYEFKKDNGSLVVSLSTENSNCANTYVQKGKSKATPEHHIAKSYGDETVVPATKGVYSISIEATKDCKYTISISQTKIKISEIKQGVYKDLRLEKDEVAFSFYHHVIDTPFKILSMQQYGQVMISIATMDRSAIESFQNITKFDDKALSQFQWPGTKDVSRVSTVDKGYCTNCYYLILVKGLKKTWTSIMLYTSDVDIPLTTGDEITDMLVESEIMHFKMYTHSSKKVNISLFVHYGQIEFTVIGKTNNTKTFKKLNTTQYWEVEIHQQLRESYLPTHFAVTAKSASMYRLIIKSEEIRASGTLHHKQMKFGYPTYMFLSSKEQSCAEATISEKDQKLLVSASRTDKNKFQNLTVSVKIGNTTINNTKNQIVQSTMVISLPRDNNYLPSQKTNITYCFSSDSYLSLTLVPTASVTFLPENSQILVKTQQNLTLNPRGKIFIQVFECEGNAHVLLSKQFTKLKGGLSQIKHWRRFGTNYLIELDETGPLYMNIDGPKTLVKWQHVDMTKGEGLGYYYFRTPHTTYDKEGNDISFQIPPLLITEALLQNTTIQGINYTLMASDSKASLKSGVQCNIGNLYKQSEFVVGSDINKTIQMSIPVSEIKERYINATYIFASVVAEVTLITPTNVSQLYRFIYDDEQILMKQVSLTREDDHKKYGSWFWILWGATLVVIALYFLSKIAINKYKNRHMRLAQGTDVEINQVDSIR